MGNLASGPIIHGSAFLVLKAPVTRVPYWTIPTDQLVFVREDVIVSLGLVGWLFDVFMIGLMRRCIVEMLGRMMATFLL